MLKNEMWKIFKATGSIDSYLCYKELDKMNNNEVKESDKEEKMIQGL